MKKEENYIKKKEESMKIYVWEDLPVVSGNFHPGGGALVIADNLHRAIELLIKKIKENLLDSIYAERIKDIEIYEKFYEIDGGKEEKVIIFPNAGCC